MTRNEVRIPKRRFKEFESAEAWEQRKLGELARFSKGRGYSKSDLVEKGFPVVLYGRLYTKYEAVISNVDTFVESNINAIYSEGNEVIVPASGESSEDISRASVVINKGVILGGDLNIIKAQKDIYPIFLALTISNGTTKKEMAKRAQGKSVVHLHNFDLKEIELHYPSVNEQQRIGDFFKTLDDTITIHQRKLEKLKALKTAYLAKMFPADGESKPKLRFKGFADDWEQRKLGEISEIRTGSSDLQDAIVDGKYPMFVRSENVERSNRYIFDGEAILIPGEGRLGYIYHYIVGKFDYHQRVYKVSNFSEFNIDGKFILFDLQRNFKKHALKFTVKATVDSLRLPMLTDYRINIPKSKEQIRIGNFFKTLDDTIAIHQRKLEKLQNIKQAYLNEMFV